jgi:hypothetical protein
MGRFRNRLNRRFPRLGLASDLAMVGATASRVVRSRNGSGSARPASGVELALAGGAAVRLLGRWRRRRRNRRLAQAIEAAS